MKYYAKIQALLSRDTGATAVEYALLVSLMGGPSLTMAEVNRVLVPNGVAMVKKGGQWTRIKANLPTMPIYEIKQMASRVPQKVRDGSIQQAMEWKKIQEKALRLLTLL